MVLIRKVRDRLAVRRDPVKFHRRRGVKIGARVELIGATPYMFGSEPYLVTIGDDVTISDDVTFITHDGGLRVVRRDQPGAFYYAPIVVESGSFVGAGAFLMPGVTVGAGSVVGARSVVSRDVPPGTVVAGVPAREIKRVDEYVASRRDDWLDTSGLSAKEKEVKLRDHFNLCTAEAGSAGYVTATLPRS